MNNSQTELQMIAQEFIDDVNWYGTLREIQKIVPAHTDIGRIISQAIAFVEPQLTIEEAIANYGLKNFMAALLEIAQATSTSKPCPEEVKYLLEQIIQTRFDS